MARSSMVRAGTLYVQGWQFKSARANCQILDLDGLTGFVGNDSKRCYHPNHVNQIDHGSDKLDE